MRQEDGQILMDKVVALAALDKVELKKVYKEQLRKPRDAEATSGAGLGLIDIARKASAPVVPSLKLLDNGTGYFSLSVQI